MSKKANWPLATGSWPESDGTVFLSCQLPVASGQ
jgi:hypothetical protein